MCYIFGSVMDFKRLNNLKLCRVPFITTNFIVLLLILLLNNHEVYGQHESTSFNTNNTTFNQSKAIWVSDVLYKAMVEYTPSSMPLRNNSECTRDGEIYRQHLANLTKWAVQMYESGTHSLGGIIVADKYQMGHFDECVNVSYPVRNIKGKYCLATLKFAPSKGAYPQFYTPPAETYFQDPPPDSVVWDKIKRTKDPRMVYRDEIFYGICVPSSCQTEDVQYTLNITINSKFANNNLVGEIFMDDTSCYSKDEAKHDMGFYIMQSIIILLCALGVIATIYDYFIAPKTFQSPDSSVNKFYAEGQRGKPSKLEETLLAFSLRVNMNDLTSQGTNSSLDVLNGGKFLCLFFIILGHRALYALGTTLHNPEYWEASVISQVDMTFMSGTHLVDTFFLIGGFLAFLGVYNQLEKTKRFNLPLLVLFRWLRLIPVYSVVIGIYALMLLQLGSGPIWKRKIGLESENCRENWWANLIFINNYYNSEKSCLLMSWYLACDMHFFLIGACLVYLLWKSPKLGEVIFGIVFMISLIIPFVETYRNKYDGKVRLYIHLLENPFKSEEFRSYYIASHTRSIPYFMGILLGYVAYKMKKANYSFPRYIRISGTALFFFAYALQTCSLVIYTPGREYSALENAIFAVILPLSWSIGNAWFVLVLYTSELGFYSWLFAQKIYAPLSRLTYCAVLIHPAVQITQAASNPNSEYLTYPKMAWMAFGDVSLSFFLALFLYILVEAPFRTLQKLWLQNGGRKREDARNLDQLQQQTNHAQSNGNSNNMNVGQIGLTSAVKQSSDNGYFSPSIKY